MVYDGGDQGYMSLFGRKVKVSCARGLAYSL